VEVVAVTMGLVANVLIPGELPVRVVWIVPVGVVWIVPVGVVWIVPVRVVWMVCGVDVWIGEVGGVDEVRGGELGTDIVQFLLSKSAGSPQHASQSLSSSSSRSRFPFRFALSCEQAALQLFEFGIRRLNFRGVED